MKLLCAKEVAVMLGISARTVQRLMASGELPALRVGPKVWRTSRAEVGEYVGRQLEHYRREMIPFQTQTSVCEIRHVQNT